MAIIRMQAKKWERLIEADDPTVQDYSGGPSPGGAAGELGISRQAVHQAIQRGDLDALYVYQGIGLSHYTISRSSLERYRAVLRERAKRDLARLAKRL